MDLEFRFFAAFLLGLLLTVTVRWIVLLYNVHKIKVNQKEPLDRLINITSNEILHAVLRKRTKQVSSVMNKSKYYHKTKLNAEPNALPEISSSDIDSIYNAFREKGLSLSLIPNEDICIAYKKGLLEDSNRCFLNEEIIKRKSKQEIKAIEEKKLQHEREKQQREWEKLKKQREQELEDSINI